ncbi:MAG TPA: NAD-dependent epimerase/dehydratase family protein [Chloroflexota bacterium]
MIVRVLVTGGTGFIGQHVAADLTCHGHDVVLLARHPSPDLPYPQVAADVESPEARAAARGVDAIVHLAGSGNVQESFDQPLRYVKTHVGGTASMLEAAREAGAIFVLASTQRLYRPSPDPLPEDAPLAPRDPYAFAKELAERLVTMYHQLYGLRTVTLRLFSVYGPGQRVRSGNSGVAALFLQRALANEPLVVESPWRRDLTYVSDVAQGVRLALSAPRWGRTYNIASGVGTTVEELARLAIEVVGSSSPILKGSFDLEGNHLVADIARARAELGYAPRVALRQGLELHAAWLRNHA